MKVRGEKKIYPRRCCTCGTGKAISLYCALLCRNGAKEGIKELRRFSAKLTLLSVQKKLSKREWESIE